ncbi:MAG: DNA polymerase III subunit gamma/tau [bacterium]|nr:DNA polymerase III subunit gamma/tau [bacterium]
MANQALYRKYRPKTFGEIVGQEHVVQTLRNALASDLISHAYLFSGPRGSGKTSLARLLAKGVNCLSRSKNGEPCNTCSACVEFNEGKAMDLIEIDAASNRGIDEIRDLKEGIAFSPIKLKYKVFIVDEAHQLTKEAANALLKTLEEPPAHAIFVLATTEPQKMIATIISRCQRFDFRRFTIQEILKRLNMIVLREGADVQPEALELIALGASGSLRDAESLLDKVLTFHSSFATTKKISAEEVRELLGIIDLATISEFAQLLYEKKASQAIAFLHKSLEEGIDPQEFLKALSTYLRYTLLLKVSPKLEETILAGFTKEQVEKMKAQSKQYEEKDLQKTLEHFLSAETKMKYSSIPQLPLELAIIDSCGVV